MCSSDLLANTDVAQVLGRDDELGPNGGQVGDHENVGIFFDRLAKRQMLLDDASGAMDSERVAAIFNAFKGVQPQTQASQAKAELARQVAPSRSSTASTPPQAAKTYTEADWKYWMDPRRRHDTNAAQLAQIGRAHV